MDAVLVQDLGVLRMLRQTVPDLPVHASTQMTVHNLDGVKACADLGMSRVVLSRSCPGPDRVHLRPLSGRDRGFRPRRFVHVLLRAVLSVLRHRGTQRQPGPVRPALPSEVRLGNKAGGSPLSLKDMSLAGHLRELRKMGVACVKIEGRMMKRPEYVAIVTGIYAQAIREGTGAHGRGAGAAALRLLPGRLHGRRYFLGQTGPEMFGTRQDEAEPRELFTQARAT